MFLRNFINIPVTGRLSVTWYQLTAAGYDKLLRFTTLVRSDSWHATSIIIITSLIAIGLVP